MKLKTPKKHSERVSFYYYLRNKPTNTCISQQTRKKVKEYFLNIEGTMAKKSDGPKRFCK